MLGGKGGKFAPRIMLSTAASSSAKPVLLTWCNRLAAGPVDAKAEHGATFLTALPRLFWVMLVALEPVAQH